MPILEMAIQLVPLYESYSTLLWEEGSHKQNVEAFIREIDDIFRLKGVYCLDDEAISFVVSSLRSKKNSNATINRKISAVFKLLRKAHRSGAIARLPSYVRLPEKNGRVRYLTASEEHELFGRIAIRDRDHARLCVFLVDTGARVGEALALKHSDIFDSKATFWITKSGHSRTVPLTARALDSIGHTTDRAVGPFADISYQRFLYNWNAAKAACGLGADKQVVPHILRHTCASRLVQAGIDLRRVQTFLGHRSIQMTLKYAHLATSDLDQCVVALERMTDGAR